mgnify:CR=1 FL=1
MAQHKKKQNFPLRFVSDELEKAVKAAAALRGISINAYINERLKRTLPKKAI